MGFYTTGFGCQSCIGNSGELDDEVSAAIAEKDLVVGAVLSGNRNFEGRVHPLTRANYLASPPLVVAYALAGRLDFDFDKEPLGNVNGKVGDFSSLVNNTNLFLSKRELPFSTRQSSPESSPVSGSR